MKTISAIIAASVLFSTAAFADGDDGSAVTRGTSGVVFAPGVPAVTPFVSDRTAKRYAPTRQFQPGPFHEGTSK